MSSSTRDLSTGSYVDASLLLPGAPTGPLQGTTFAVKNLFDVGGPNNSLLSLSTILEPPITITSRVHES